MDKYTIQLSIILGIIKTYSVFDVQLVFKQQLGTGLASRRESEFFRWRQVFLTGSIQTLNSIHTTDKLQNIF